MFIFFLVDSWAVSTETQSTKVVMVLTFDSPHDFAELHKAFMAIQSVRMPYLVMPIHLATHDVAERILAEFDKGET